MRTLSFILIIASLLACNRHETARTLFTLKDSTGINFVNEVHDTKDLNILNYRNFYNGGGVAIGDINNDGLADVFFTANQGPNKLYLNKGHLKFEDISQKAGFQDKKQWSTGVVMVDVNNDGWLDIFVCNAGSMNDSTLRRNQLFINNHDLTFTESAAKYGLDDIGYSIQVSFFDYDMDGDLDCFVINNSPVSPTNLNYLNLRDVPDRQSPVAPQFKGGGDHLYRNDNGHFTEVTKDAGIHGSIISFGLGVTVGDVNNDGYPDVYVSNDYYERDYLYINQRNGTFRDELEDCMQHTSLASMGADFGDLNNDGYPDIFTTDMLPGEDYRLKTTLTFEDINVYRLKLKNGFYHQFFQNTLQLNDRNGHFCDIANYAGVSATDWSWGALMFDADNDGFTDLYVCNGIYHDLINQDFLDFSASDIMRSMSATGKKADLEEIIDKMPSIHVLNKCYQNSGHLVFRDIGENWGFTQPSFSNGAAYGDLDNDGDLDLVINNVNQPAFLYENHSREYNGNNYVAYKLTGTGNNKFAVGAKIMAYAGGEVMTREVIPSRGFQSSMDYQVIIGLGKTAKLDSVIIHWPDLSFSRYVSPAINKVYTIEENKERRYPLTSAAQTPLPDSNVLFRQQPAPFDKHAEDDYVDFFYERNVPEMLSRLGPKAAVADLNGDGLDDVVIGGTSGHPAQVYLQSAGNKFLRSVQPSISQFSDFEDNGVLIFDANHDSRPDILLCPGGNNVSPGSRQLQLRLFLNDGSAHFTIDAEAFPPNQDNLSVAVADDFNHDGYPDLFVGGRSVPKEYGLDPVSHLFKNDGRGHFTDVAGTVAPGLVKIGMVTGAAWADIDADGEEELIVTGEWMAPAIFHYDVHSQKFSQIKSTGLDHLFGLWQTVTVADLNGDGRPDLVLGNLGENFYLRPDSSHPVKLFVNDFDQNGVIDKILTYTVDGHDKPVFLKHDLEDAMPFLKKNNLRHAEYATKSVQDLIPADALNKALQKTFNYSASIIAYNEGNGKFSVRKLPDMTQLSSVNAVVATDINGDGRPDLILGGNQLDFLPQLERLDGSRGDVLINKGQGQFAWTGARESGLNVTGEVRDLAPVRIGDRRYFLFLINDAYPALYELNNKPKTARQQ